MVSKMFPDQHDRMIVIHRFHEITELIFRVIRFMDQNTGDFKTILFGWHGSITSLKIHYFYFSSLPGQSIRRAK